MGRRLPSCALGWGLWGPRCRGAEPVLPWAVAPLMGWHWATCHPHHSPGSPGASCCRGPAWCPLHGQGRVGPECPAPKNPRPHNDQTQVQMLAAGQLRDSIEARKTTSLENSAGWEDGSHGVPP